MGRRWSAEAESCGRPKWRATKRGRRCASVCEGGRWRFVKQEECEGGKGGEEAASEPRTSPDVEAFSGLDPKVFRPMPLVKLELMPLWTPESEKRRGRRGRRRR